MVDTNLLERIDRITLSPRAAALREQFFNSKPRVAADYAKLAIESWKETEGDPIDIRRAKLTKKILEGGPIPIFPGQKLVASQTKYFVGAYPCPEFNSGYLLPLLSEEKGQITMGGPVLKGILTEEDLKDLIEATKFWAGKTPVDKVKEAVHEVMGNWYDDLVEAGTPSYESLNHGPYGVLWDRLVAWGLRGHIKEAQRHIQEWNDNQESDIDKVHFWKAVIVSCEAVINYAHRYAREARELAAGEKDPAWRAELEEIAKTCERVPEHPAETFREGLQSVVIGHRAVGFENNRYAPSSMGRVDQYLYPQFKRDLKEGRLTIEEAADLLADFLQYCARQQLVVELSWRDYNQTGILNSIGLGGTDEDGNDASNELTYLILHVMGLVRYAEPHLAIGWHKGTPSWLMRKALETNLRVGGGVPQFQNCDHFVDLMIRRGVTEKMARTWISHGCSQIEPHDQGTSMAPSYINVPLCVDMALHNGIASRTGKRLGPETGDPRAFGTFQDFYTAFKTQAEHLIRKQLWHDKLCDQVRAQYYRQPLASALLPGCLEKGMDFGKGGLVHYRMNYKKDRGLVPTADSLTAVKKLVYDDKKVSMAELLRALDSNFSGEKGEEIRQMCLTAPKYGNDIDEVDMVLRDVARFTGTVITSMKNIWGYNFAINRNGQGWHYMAGKKLAALPNGRKAGEILPDGSLSAMQGMDRSGPTALLSSALKANFCEQALGGILTVKLPASLIGSKDLREKVAALTEGFFGSGGTYIQYNVLDANVLRDAKIHPEKYRDLVVRVGGYSAYFINLSPEIQDEIINRTEHSLAGV